MISFEAHCENCKINFQVHIGAVIKCPRCQQLIQIKPNFIIIHTGETAISIEEIAGIVPPEQTLFNQRIFDTDPERREERTISIPIDQSTRTAITIITRQSTTPSIPTDNTTIFIRN